MPKSVKINSITVLNFPESNTFGNTWDGSLQGSYPDVYFNITDNNGNLIYSHPTNLRFENLRKADLPKTWSSSTSFASFDNLEQGFSVSLFDFESLTSDEFMGGVQTNKTFQSLVADGDLPFEVTISYEQYSFKVGLEWIF